jgi:hypothetical protein
MRIDSYGPENGAFKKTRILVSLRETGDWGLSRTNRDRIPSHWPDASFQLKSKLIFLLNACGTSSRRNCLKVLIIDLKIFNTLEVRSRFFVSPISANRHEDKRRINRAEQRYFQAS